MYSSHPPHTSRINSPPLSISAPTPSINSPPLWCRGGAARTCRPDMLKEVKRIHNQTNEPNEKSTNETKDEMIDNDLSLEIRRLMMRVATNRLGRNNRWLTFEMLGPNPHMVLPRLMLLWTIGLPILALRIAAGGVLMFLSMGLPAMVFAGGATAGTIVFQNSYRAVGSWAMTNDVFQATWDAFATTIAVIFSIFVYATRLMVEIHDGLCPLYALLVDILYELLQQLAVIWYAAPVLQYFAMWIVRLVTSLVEPFLDLLVSVMESLMFLVTELSTLIPMGGIGSDLGDIGSGLGDLGSGLGDLAVGAVSIPGFSLADAALILGDGIGAGVDGIGGSIGDIGDIGGIGGIGNILSGIDINLPDISGFTPLQVAKMWAQRAFSSGLSLPKFNTYCMSHPEEPACHAGRYSARKSQTPTTSQPTGAPTANRYPTEQPTTGSPTTRSPTKMDAATAAIAPIGDKLLEVCVIVFTVMVRIVQAFFVAFLPLIYSFLRLVLPIMLRLAPLLIEIVSTIANVFTSDAVRRIFDFLLQAMPLLYEFFGTLLCTLVIYLGAALCYIIYGIVITLGFVLRYMLRPIVCGVLACFAGCFEAFIMSAIDGQTCYTCGQYNTACGCRKSTFPRNGCGGDCRDSEGLVVPASTPTSAAPPGKPLVRSASYGNQSTALSGHVESNQTYTDEGADDEANQAATGSSGFPLNQLPTSNTVADSSQFDDNTVDSDRRRRWTYNSSNSSYNSNPVATKSSDITRQYLVSAETAVVTASPGIYCEMGLVESDAEHTVSAVLPVMGTLPRYSARLNSTVCKHGVSAECPSEDAWAVLKHTLETHSAAGLLQSGASFTWQPVDWILASARHLPNPIAVSPWVRIDFKTPVVLIRAQLFWRSNDVALQAPSDVRYELFAGDPGLPIGSLRDSLRCGLHLFSRTDTWETGTDGNWSRAVVTAFKATMLQPCPETNSSNNIGSFYALRYVRLLVQTPRDSSGLPEWTTLSAPNTISQNVEIWDACGQHDLRSLVDGRRGGDNSPVVFSEVPGAKTTLALNFNFADARALHTLVVHTRGPMGLGPSTVSVCPRNGTGTGSIGCMSATPLTESTSASRDFVSSRADAYLARNPIFSALPSSWWNESGYYTDAYYSASGVGEPARDASYTVHFVSPVFADGFTVWFSQGDTFAECRNTTWGTVLMELNLDAARSESAQWTLNPLRSIVCPSDGQPSTLQPYQTTSTQDNAFGPAESGFRRWFALEEIDAFTTPMAEVVRLRRLLSTEETTDQQTDKDVVAARRLMNGRKLSWERTSPRTSLADVMDPMKSSNNKFKPSSAPENGRHQPFYDDLSQMPDPDTEPVFRCDRYLSSVGFNRSSDNRSSDSNSSTGATEVSRMACFSPEAQTLAAPIGTPDSARGETEHRNTFSSEAFADHGDLVSVAEVRRLQRHMDSLNVLRTQRQLLRTVGQTRWPRAGMSGSVDSAKRPPALAGTSSAVRNSGNRRLMDWLDDVGNAFQTAGSSLDIKDWVKNLVKDAISGLQSLICSAMQCSSYCTKERGCHDDQDLGACFKAFGQWTAEQIFGCSAGEDLLQCITRPIRDMFKWLLRQLLWLVDLFGSSIGSLTGIGDMLKNIACIGCSLTSIATGVIADFIEDFPVSLCAAIVDKGSAQCNMWNLGTEDFGANVFGNIFPMLKLMFGLVQVLPAFMETIVEVAVILFSDIVELFPELMGDMFDVVLWLIASSEVVGAVEVFFEAFDPIISGATGGLQESMKDAAAQPAPQHPDILATDHQTTQPADKVCARQGETTSTNKCGSVYTRPRYGCTNDSNGSNGSNCTNGSNETHNDLRSRLSPVDQDPYSLSFALDANCGCVVQQPKCSDGPGTGNCAFQEGNHALRLKRREEYAAELSNDPSIVVLSNGSVPDDDCTHWPYCPEVQSRVIGKGKASAASGEFKDACVTSKKCKVQGLAPTGNTDLRKASKLPFNCFSRTVDRNSSDSVFWGPEDSCPGKLRVAETRAEAPVHRRRAVSDEYVARRVARQLMGIGDLFEDHRDSEFWSSPGAKQTTDGESALDRLRHATRGLDTAIQAGNRSYVYHQSVALRGDVIKLAEFWTAAVRNLSDSMSGVTSNTRAKQTWDYTDRLIQHGRRLMSIGFSGVKAENIGCGWLSTENSMPNTYPCCRGLWCCVAPPFDDDFYPEKSWFAWRDSWTLDSQCPYISSYPQGWLFALRALCKLARDAGGGIGGVWPYSLLVDSMWSAFMFPGDEWPDTHSGMSMCVTLNIGVFVALAVIIAVLAHSWQDMEDFVYANFAIFESLRRSPDKPTDKIQELER